MSDPSLNTHLATINEMLTGYYINGKRWFGGNEVQETFEAKKRIVSADDYLIQDGRAIKMAEEFLSRAKAYGFSGVAAVYWTARPGAVRKIVDPQNKLKLSDTENPSDLLIKFNKVPYGASQFLGLSAKSHSGRKKAGIGFKNPGLGSIERDLHINLHNIVDRYVEMIRKEHGLSDVAAQRRVEIAKKARLKKKVDEAGDDALEEIRNKLYRHMAQMNKKDLHIYIIKEWLDADELYPPFLKVTGQGQQAPFTAKVEDPRDNEKLEAINTSTVAVKKAERHSIQVLAGITKLFNIRVKFDKQKLAGSIVFAADPL